ncbi:hypothetical protein INP48_04260 [Xanthomonas perforans]|nr:hypothetical protein [Xanthomonas perforans]
MNEFTPPPWKRSNSKGKAKSTPLTDAQKAAAKQRAEEAGGRIRIWSTTCGPVASRSDLDPLLAWMNCNSSPA